VKIADITAAQATIAGALLALLGGVAGASITAWSSQRIASGTSLTSLQIEELKAKGSLDLESSKQRATELLERKKFETSLILEAIKTPLRADAIRNLKFFVAAGFISDPDGRIAALRDESLPSIGEPSAEAARRALEATGTIIITGDTRNVTSCTGVAIAPQRVITAEFCVPPTGVSIVFRVGEQTLPARVLTRLPDSDLAVLQIESPERLSSFLDGTRIREPVVGERVYLAIWLFDQTVQLRTCSVVEKDGSKIEFTHDCETGPGSAGAVILALKDDMLLGIHHSKTTGGGRASKLAGLVGVLSPLGGR
jgi:hypothetical protein